MSVDCGDSEPGSSTDGGTDGESAAADAWVDNGPLDCGEAPSPDSFCIRGRLYDFLTDEPIPARSEQEIVTFKGDSDLLEVKYDSDSYRGRIASNGRFVTWTNSPRDRCFAQFDEIDGFASNTINCNTASFGYYNDNFEYRIYQISDLQFDAWLQAYTGHASLIDDSPFFIGTCRNMDFSAHTTGTYDWSFIPSTLLPYDSYALAPGLTDFEIAGVIPALTPPSGALLLWLDLGSGGDPQDGMTIFFSCHDDDYSASVSEITFRRHEIDTGEAHFAFLNAID